MNNYLLLQREMYTSYGIFGSLMLVFGDNTPSITLAKTLERTWLNNEVNESCIPQGVYLLEPAHYNRGGYDTVRLVDVPDRSDILIHIGNWQHNSLGCILVGSEIAILSDKLALLDSAKAFKWVMRFINKSNPTRLIISQKMNFGDRNNALPP